MRRTFAHEVRQIQQFVTADGHPFGLLVHEEVRVFAHAFRYGLFFRAEIIPEPLQAQPGALGHAHDMPAARHGTAERVHAAFGVDGHFVGVSKHHAAGADGDKRFAVFHHTGTDSRRRVVAGAAHYRRAFAQPGEGRRFFGNGAGHFRRFVHFGKQGFINIQFLKDFVAPAAVFDIQQLHTGSIGHFGGKFAGQFIAHIVFRQQDMGAFCVNFRFVVAHPQNLRSRKARHGRVGRDFDQALFAHFFRQFFAFFGGTLVAPDNGTAQHFAFFIQHDKSVHLPGNAQPADIRRIHAALRNDRPDGLRRRVPPILRVLFGPAVLGLVHGIFHGFMRDHIAFGIKQHGFGAAGT